MNRHTEAAARWVREARQNNRDAMRADLPRAVRSFYRAKREASMAAARAAKFRADRGHA